MAITRRKQLMRNNNPQIDFATLEDATSNSLLAIHGGMNLGQVASSVMMRDFEIVVSEVVAHMVTHGHIYESCGEQNAKVRRTIKSFIDQVRNALIEQCKRDAIARQWADAR